MKIRRLLMNLLISRMRLFSPSRAFREAELEGAFFTNILISSAAETQDKRNSKINGKIFIGCLSSHNIYDFFDRKNNKFSFFNLVKNLYWTKRYKKRAANL